MAKYLGFPTVATYGDLDLYDLPLNHAYVLVNTSVENVGIYSVQDGCFNCPYNIETQLTPGVEEALMVDTSVQNTWRILRTERHDQIARAFKQGWFCQLRPPLQEFGVYRLDIGQCVLRNEVPPANSYYPLMLFGLILSVSCFVYALVKYLRKRKRTHQCDEKVLQINTDITEHSSQALHFFRGVIVSLIIFMTTGGGGYPALTRQWGGMTAADCLFFAYIWSVGVNIPVVMHLAFSRQNKCYIVRDIFVRSFLLIFLGTVIDSTVENQMTFTNFWCPLQKLGISYFIVASAYVLTVQKFAMKPKKTICKAITNIISLLWCWIIAAFLLAIIIILISAFVSFNCLFNTNLDDKIFTDVSENCSNDITEIVNKIFVSNPVRVVDVNSYVGFSGGLMGVMSAIIYMMIGLKAGVVYLHYTSHSDRLKLWSLWITLFGIGGVIFAVLSYPTKFNLWPVSTIILLTTVYLFLYIFAYIFAEMWKISSSVLRSTGFTSLIILSGHLLFSNSVPFRWQLMFRSHLVYVLQSFWIVFLWLLVAYGLKKRNFKLSI